MLNLQDLRNLLLLKNPWLMILQALQSPSWHGISSALAKSHMFPVPWNRRLSTSSPEAPDFLHCRCFFTRSRPIWILNTRRTEQPCGKPLINDLNFLFFFPTRVTTGWRGSSFTAHVVLQWSNNLAPLRRKVKACVYGQPSSAHVLSFLVN